MEKIRNIIDLARARERCRQVLFGLVRFLFIGSLLFLAFGLSDYLFCRISAENVDFPAYRVAFSLIFAVLIIFSAWQLLGRRFLAKISRHSIAERFAECQPGRFDNRYLLAAVDFTEYPPDNDTELEDYVVKKAGETDFSVKIFDAREEMTAFWATGILLVLWSFAFCIFSKPIKTAATRIFFPFAAIQWIQPQLPPETDTEKLTIGACKNAEHDAKSRLTVSEAAEIYRHYLGIIRDELRRALRMQSENRQRLAEESTAEVVSIRYWQREVRKLLTDENSGIPHYFLPIRAAIQANESDGEDVATRENLLNAITAGIAQLESEQLVLLEILFADWAGKSSSSELPTELPIILKAEILAYQQEVELAIERMLDMIENWEKRESLRLEWGELFAKQAALYLRSKSEMSETIGLTISELTPGRRQLLQAMSNEQRSIGQKAADLINFSRERISDDVEENAEKSAMGIDRNRLGNSMREQRELLRFFLILAKDAPQVEEFAPLLLADSSRFGGGESGLTEWLVDPAVGEDSQPERVETDHVLSQNKGSSEPGGPDPNMKQTGETGSGSGGSAGETATRASVQRDGSAGKFDLREQWGDLPERLRKELPEPPKDEPLPQYRDAIERYFRELIHQPSQKPTS